MSAFLSEPPRLRAQSERQLICTRISSNCHVMRQLHHHTYPIPSILRNITHFSSPSLYTAPFAPKGPIRQNKVSTSLAAIGLYVNESMGVGEGRVRVMIDNRDPKFEEAFTILTSHPVEYVDFVIKVAHNTPFIWFIHYIFMYLYIYIFTYLHTHTFACF